MAFFIWMTLKKTSFYRDAFMQAVLSTRNPSVRLYVKRVNWIKRKKLLQIFLYHIKDPFIYFCDTDNVLRGTTPVPEILGQTDPFPSKMPIFNRFFLVAPQP